jgi:hypothetical protein
MTMAVNVDRVVSDVVAEPEPAPPQKPAEPTPWEELDRWRALQARLMKDRLRTCAEGFDD